MNYRPLQAADRLQTGDQYQARDARWYDVPPAWIGLGVASCPGREFRREL